MLQNNPRLISNNFDLLRLLFAGTVCLVHVHNLSGYQQLAWIHRFLSSAVAVKAFFVVSGFLIFMSYERSSSLISYASKRFRRIYPAYFTVVMLCAVGLAGLSSEGLADYISSAWMKYTLANLSFLNFIQHSLPGVFTGNKLQTVNGALWTLKIEVMFYITVPLFCLLFRRFGLLPIIAITYFLSVTYAIIFSWLGEQYGSGIYPVLGRQLPGQLSYFIAGAFFYYYLPTFERYAGCFLLCAIPVLVADIFRPLPVLEPFALAATVIFFALFLYLGNFGKYGDFSYGVYILHFPVIQCFISFGWFAGKPWLFLMSILIVTTTTAFLMWHLVEKRFLNRNSHYIAASIATPEQGASELHAS